MKSSIRNRTWSSDEKADSRSVGENFRDMGSIMSSVVPMKLVEINDYVYSTADGISFSSDAAPFAVLNVYTASVDGTWQSTGTSADWSFGGSTVRAKFSGLNNGQKYSTIRLLVIG